MESKPNWLDRVALSLWPKLGHDRIASRSAANVLMSYNAASRGRMGAGFRATSTSADAASSARNRISYASRDIIRNTPIAARGQSVITNATVGDGIIPSVRGGSKAEAARLMSLVRSHLDMTSIDVDGRSNLYGLQRLTMNAIVADGEVLVIRRWRRDWRKAGLSMPFQISVREIDRLDSSIDRNLEDGGFIREGIEYDRNERRVAYHLLAAHPGSSGWTGALPHKQNSIRVAAEDCLHIFRQDRPEQMRGVSWFAPVATTINSLADLHGAQLTQQQIAACFAVFRITPDSDGIGADGQSQEPLRLSPGIIQDLPPGQDVRFGEPPRAGGVDEFTRVIMRLVASGLGITYEALTGDLGQVNFSSARMGRMEMNRNVSNWQWLLLIPQMMNPIGNWMVEALAVMGSDTKNLGEINWTPPSHTLVDPSREIPAMGEAVRLGFRTRSDVIRSLGCDPEAVEAEMSEDNRRADKMGLHYDSDGRSAKYAGAPDNSKKEL